MIIIRFGCRNKTGTELLRLPKLKRGMELLRLPQ